jgi:outer membrane protein TolC
MLPSVTMRHNIDSAGETGSLATLPVVLILALTGAVAVASSAQATVQADSQDPSANSQTVVITLEEAIHRAEANEPTYASAKADSSAARLDRSIARAGLLPDAVYHNQALYTQPNGQQNQAGQGVGSQPSPRFIANNAVREYASQGVINETASLGQVAAVRRADAASAFASAELEISRRGLVAAVTGLYFGLAAADHKLAIAERGQAEAAEFTKLTEEREAAREAAHADAVKAHLQQQQRERDLSDARLAAEKARLELGVLLFPDPRIAYTIDVQESAPPLASRAEVEHADVLAARAAYLPALGLNYTYGIDAPQFAVNGPEGVRNLGYSASVTVDIPVWDWFATEHKVKQSEIRRDAAKVSLTATQRRVIARLEESYAEAAGAREQFASLDASASTAAESLRLTKLRYTGGEATVLEVVDAQNSNISAQNAREDGRVRYEAALAELQTVTGTM